MAEVILKKAPVKNNLFKKTAANTNKFFRKALFVSTIIVVSAVTAFGQSLVKSSYSKPNTALSACVTGSMLEVKGIECNGKTYDIQIEISRLVENYRDFKTASASAYKDGKIEFSVNVRGNHTTCYLIKRSSIQTGQEEMILAQKDDGVYRMVGKPIDPESKIKRK